MFRPIVWQTKYDGLDTWLLDYVVVDDIILEFIRNILYISLASNTLKNTLWFKSCKSYFIAELRAIICFTHSHWQLSGNKSEWINQ